MNKEDLTKLGLTDEELIQKIIVLHSKDIEKHKTSLSTVQTELDGAKKQLTDANAAIEGFKKLDVDGIKAAADEWKAKAEKAQADASQQVAQLKFDHALDGALGTAKAKNGKAVKALLNTELLKLADDGSISGLKEQLEKIKSENDFLFTSDEPTPTIVLGGNNKPVGNMSSFEAAARKGAGLPLPEGK